MLQRVLQKVLQDIIVYGKNLTNNLKTTINTRVLFTNLVFVQVLDT